MPRSAPFSIVLLLTNFGCFGPTDLINGFVSNLPEPEFCSEDDHLLTPGDFGLGILVNTGLQAGQRLGRPVESEINGVLRADDPEQISLGKIVQYGRVIADQNGNLRLAIDQGIVVAKKGSIDVQRHPILVASGQQPALVHQGNH